MTKRGKKVTYQELARFARAVASARTWNDDWGRIGTVSYKLPELKDLAKDLAKRLKASRGRK